MAIVFVFFVVIVEVGDVVAHLPRSRAGQKPANDLLLLDDVLDCTLEGSWSENNYTTITLISVYCR